MKQNLNLIKFVFSKYVSVNYKAPRLVLVDFKNNKTHVIEKNYSSSITKFCNPCSLEDIFIDNDNYIAELSTEFLRLTKHGFIVDENEQQEVPINEQPKTFWDDAYIYHMLSRTTKDSIFLSRQEQHKRFLENASFNREVFDEKIRSGKEIHLPSHNEILPQRDFLDVMYSRRTKRIFGKAPITLEQISWILGITWGYTLSCVERPYGIKTNLRTSPSCGGLQSIQVYPVILNVENLSKGVYWYNPEKHSLTTIDNNLTLEWVLEACAGQEWVTGAAAFFIMTAKVDFTMEKYNVSRLYRMLHVEAGHFSQTFLLSAEYAGLAACLFGAMNEEIIEKKIGVEPNCEPLLFITGLGEFDKSTSFSEWVKGATMEI